jgi:hypothetical protein
MNKNKGTDMEKQGDFWFNVMIQVSIGMFGLLAMVMALSQDPQLRLAAPLFGLCGQPFWLYYCRKEKAWGMLAISLAYTAVYGHAIFMRVWTIYLLGK